MKPPHFDLSPNKKRTALNSLIEHFERHTLQTFSLGVILLCGLLIGIPTLFIKFGIGKSPTNNELVIVSGHIRSVEKTSTNGKSPQKIIYLSINEDLRQFKIDEHGISAISQLETLTPGLKIAISISKAESDQSNPTSGIDAILNTLFEWRKMPTVYELRTERGILLKLDNYNDEMDASNIHAFYLAIIGLLALIAVYFVRCFWN